MNQVLIYSSTNNSRLRYTLDLLFRQILGLPNWRLTNNTEDFLAATGTAKVNYSTISFEQIPQLLPHDFLTQKGITSIAISPQLYQGQMAAFFVQSNANLKELNYPFDLFSWVFYLVSRYEEYLPFEGDQWERFSAPNSLAFQYGFLEQPLVNLWAWDWAKQLQQYYPDLIGAPPSYQFTPSYDIDHAFAFAFKSWWRQAAAWARNHWQRDQESLQLRRATRQDTGADPYAVYPYLQQLAEHYQHQPFFFWLLGDYGPHDKNLPPHLPIMQELIHSQANYGTTGLHPSFGSNASFAQLKKEATRLEEMTQQPVQHSRQHYLRLHFPSTYQQLLELGIHNDYSMGYARALGFRASIATPFTWYDLEKEQATSLVIHPFAVMDVTLNTYLKLTPEQAVEALLPLVEQSKNVQGHFIPIWHNSSLCEAWQWKGWRKVYEALLEAATI